MNTPPNDNSQLPLYIGVTVSVDDSHLVGGGGIPSVFQDIFGLPLGIKFLNNPTFHILACKK